MDLLKIILSKQRDLLDIEVNQYLLDRSDKECEEKPKSARQYYMKMIMVGKLMDLIIEIMDTEVLDEKES